MSAGRRAASPTPKGSKVSENPLARLFDELRGEGRLDSRGHFTLDVAKALEKMRQFQLRDPRLYVLNLVAAAVANGASFVRTSSTPESFSLESDGRGYAFEDLAELFSSPFIANAPERRATQELAIGLFGTRGLTVQQVSLETWQGDLGARLAIVEGRLEIARLTQNPLPEGLNVRLSVREKSSLLDSAYGLLGKVRRVKPQTQESEYVRGLCVFSPVPITLNGEQVNLPIPCGGALVAGQVSGPDGRSFPLSAILAEQVVSRSEGPYAATLVLENRTLPGDALTVVVNGVSFSEFKEVPAYPNARVVVHASHLKKDFSQSSLVLDDEFRAMLEWINCQLDELAAELLTRHPEHEKLVLPSLSLRMRERMPNQRPTRKSGLELASQLRHWKLFRLARGEGVSLGALARQYMIHGYLPFTQHELPPVISPLLEDGSAILHVSRERAELLAAFFPQGLLELAPHRNRLDKLQVPSQLAQVPRLPGADYLVRRISEPSSLEVGVPADFPRPEVQYTLRQDGKPTRPTVNEWNEWLPNGLVIIADARQRSDDPDNEHPKFSLGRVETAVCGLLGELIEALLWDYPFEEPVRSWATAHLLEYFWVAAQHVRQPPAAFYLNLPDEEVNRKLKFFDLRQLARSPLLITSGGELRSVEWVFHNPLPAEVIGPELPELPLEGPERLLLRKREKEILEAFLSRPL